MNIRLIGEYPGFRVLSWHEGYLYASRSYRLYRLKVESSKLKVEKASDWEEVGFYRPDWLRRLAAKNRFSSRLLRSGFHAVCFLPTGRIVAILAKALAVLDPGERVQDHLES